MRTEQRSKNIPITSIDGFFSACFPWGIRNSPNTSAPAARIHRPTEPVRAAPRRLALASDWIRTGRCQRVIIVSADDITSDNLMGWFGSGFLASGSAATGEIVEEEATPFDRRRHGLIVGMGASAVVLESMEAARERGVRPICQVLGSVVANSAYHGTRLDVSHIGHVMEKLVSDAEAEHGASIATRSLRKRFSFRMKPILRRAAEAHLQKFLPCGTFSRKLRIKSSLPIQKARPDIRWLSASRMLFR